MTYLFGGSFDPITIAHEEIINFLLKNILKEDDQLYILPNGDDYHFLGKELTPYKIRKKMINAVINDQRVIISDLLNKNSFSGVYQILRILNHPIYVIGSDLLSTITTWIEPEILLMENKFLVIERKDFPINKYFEENKLLKKYQANFIITDLSIENISSSDVRLNNNYNNISKKVYEIIVNHNLYKN